VVRGAAATVIERVLVQNLSRTDNQWHESAFTHASSLFRGRHFDRTVITLCVRWYIIYKLRLCCDNYDEAHGDFVTSSPTRRY